MLAKGLPASKPRRAQPASVRDREAAARLHPYLKALIAGRKYDAPIVAPPKRRRRKKRSAKAIRRDAAEMLAAQLKAQRERWGFA